MRYIISSAMATVLAAGAALAEVPRVVTDLVPVHALVAQVMGDLGQPVLLLEQGADAHHYQLRPSQARDLADAGLVVWSGPAMTPWLDRAMGSIGSGTQLRLLDVPGTSVQDFDAAPHDHAEEAGEAPDAAEGDSHAHDGVDPHAWLDPVNAQVWVKAIAAELGRLDPDNAVTYAANADAAGQRIAALDQEIAAILQPVQQKPFVVFHNAYGYFVGHYGLTVAGTVSDGDAAEPGAAHLADLSGTVAGDGTLCLFPEAGHDPKYLQQLASGPVRLGGALDPEGVQLDPGPEAYDALLRGLAQALAACLSQG